MHTGLAPCQLSLFKVLQLLLDEGFPGCHGGRILGGGRSTPLRGGPGRSRLARSSFFQLNIVARAFIRSGFLHHVTVLSLPAGRVGVGDRVSEWVIINC